MKKIVFLIFVIGSVLFASQMYQSVPANKATILQKGKTKMFCPMCGMTLPMFYKTNHAAIDENNVTKQYCSIHCLVEDAQNHTLRNMMVVDNTTLKFIPVEKAYYVVGSNVKGTMSPVSKYAFGTLEAAKKFQAEHGGKIMKFQDVFNLVAKEFEKESKMVAQKQHKMALMGEKIYQKVCTPTDKRFKSVAKAKAFIKSSGICQNLSGKKLQAVALFLSQK